MGLFRKKTHRPVDETKGVVVGDTGPDRDLYSTDGPTGFRVVVDPPNADVDIVFIHGLTGNREKTWSHRNGKFWPGDVLPHDFPGARILTFGYDADVVRFWSIASSNRLYDHGKSLAYGLLDQRFRIGKRPIIFVAHSLGGLVCEEALNLSHKRPDLQSILANAWGIIFMGTPHGGSQLANWGHTVARYVNVFRGVNLDILQTLQPSSADLQRTEEDFQQMLRREDVKLEIFCFYEALKMNDTVGKVVEGQSAILPAYDNCSINADHRNMTKFSGPADAGYGLVRGVLERWMQKMRGNTSGTEDSSAAGPSSAAETSTAEGCPAEVRTSALNEGGNSYSGPTNVFNGAISNNKHVFAGMTVTGGTANFNIFS